MFGPPTEIQRLVIVAVSLLCAWTDLRRAKIYNGITLPTLILGIIFQFLVKGTAPGFDALWAIGLAWVLLGWMYLLKFMGAGDVKLLMALGAWVGTEQTVEIALLAVFIGAILGAEQLFRKGLLFEFMHKAWLFVLSFLVKEMRGARPVLDQKLQLPFGVALGAAAVLTVYWRPLVHLKVMPW